MSELEAVAEKLQHATFYLDVFGTCDGDSLKQNQHIKGVFREFAKVVHPDLYSEDDEKQLATTAFATLQKWLEEAENAVKQGFYGRRFSVATIDSPDGHHELVAVIKSNQLFDLYFGYSDIHGAVSELETVVRIAKDQTGEERLLVERNALKTLWASEEKDLFPYLPSMVDYGTFKQKGTPRQWTAYERLEGMFTLEQMRQAFPKGLDPLHGVWIWRRILYSLAMVHNQEVLHGALLPGHIMIEPEKHGVVLVNWCFACNLQTTTDEAYSPIVEPPEKRYQDWYPVEVRNGDKPSPATDIAMAARCMVYLMGGDPLTGKLPHESVPKPLRAFFKGCLLEQQSKRPQNAYKLLEEFDELLERLGEPYYPRRFRPLTMPEGTV